MPADDIFELGVDMTHAGQNVSNVHHFKQIGADGTGTWQDALLQIWQDNYKALLKALMVTAVEIIQVKVRKLFPTQTQQQALAVAENGTVLDTGLPPHAAALVRQRAIPTGRKGTGGVKIVGVPTQEVEDGRITVSYRNQLESYGNVSEADITDPTSGYVMRSGVLSKVDNSFRSIVKSMATPRIVTVHSRQINVGD